MGFSAIDAFAAFVSWLGGTSRTADFAAEIAHAAIAHSSDPRSSDSAGAGVPRLQRALDSIGAISPAATRAGAFTGHCTIGQPSSFLEDPVCSQYFLQWLSTISLHAEALKQFLILLLL